MFNKNQNMFICRQAQQCPADQRQSVDRKWSSELLVYKPLCSGRGRVFVQPLEVYEWDCYRQGRVDDLDRSSLNLREGGAKYFMAADNFLQAALQGCNIQRA
jgi:hypothetical protein